jgi:nucleoid DNA-binding protein
VTTFASPLATVTAVIASLWELLARDRNAWKMPAKGFKERVLIPALRKQGLSVREARAVIDAVFGSIKDGLGRHESIELPIGNFTAVENPERRGAWKFGKPTVLFAHRYKVEFLPSAELNLAAAAAPPSPPPPKRKKKRVGSELAIAAELIVEFIRENVEADSWHCFFDELRPNPSVSAVFKNAKPKPDEHRPLSEADQVIEECRPADMPQDSWDAYLEWFARWTQRVMPNALWQEAMQEAVKILVPQEPMRTLDGR